MEACEAEKGKSLPKRNRVRVPKSLIETSMSLSQGSSSDAPSDASNPWPFIKQSSLWATFESQYPSQKPHFLHLKTMKEDFREGLAIGQVVTFMNMVQETSKLQVDDPNYIINNRLEILDELETDHGFDVSFVRARLHKLQSLKAAMNWLKDESKQIHKVLEKHNLERSKIDEEVNELMEKRQELIEKRQELQELQKKLVDAEKKKNAKDEEIIKMKSKLQSVTEKIMEFKDVFKRLAATPL